MIKLVIATVEMIELKINGVFLLPLKNEFLMALTNSEIVQFLSDGYKVIEISQQTGIDKRTIEKRILVLRKISCCKSYAHLVANFLRKKIIE